jgi:type IV pilus assembly protein PilV
VSIDFNNKEIVVRANMKSATGQRGVTLLEALLGILIFSIGILSVVGMQAMVVKSIAESKYRVDASFLANDIIGQIWTDRANLASYAYNGGTPSAAVTAWVNRVNFALPGATNNPPTISVVGNAVTITLFWQHPQEAKQLPPPSPHTFRVVASIDCC